MIKEASGKDDSWERADKLLRDLSRVERVEVKFGNEIKTWYLNLTDDMNASLKAIGMKELLKEKIRLAS